MYNKSINFSLWVDFIERDFISNGLVELTQNKIVNGATSNPAIFKDAILNSHSYKNQLESLSSLTAKEKYEALAIDDIKLAADVLRPLYDEGNDGYVSIEVDPFLCDDAKATTQEGLRLYKEINRPNVMIKVPATEAGYTAMGALASEGIAVNATLIFTPLQAKKCADAFESAQSSSGKVVNTVLSVFVSRLDRLLDSKCTEKNIETGKLGIYNAANIYNQIEARKIKNLRVLFASTGVKGNDLKASYYIEELLAPNSVNTAPIKTIEAYKKDAPTEAKLPIEQKKIDELFEMVAAAGIDVDEALENLLNDGLSSFKDAFKEILDELE